MGSPFEQYLGTNYVPSVDDIVTIRKLLEVSDKEAQSIDTEIDQLERQLHILQEKRSKIYKYTEQYRALISPVRRLGRDILEEIFLACLPTDRNPCMSTREAPMLLTQVCSSWRSISHSAPRLWAAIHIVVPSGAINRPNVPGTTDYLPMQGRLVELELEKRKTAAREWLDRSGACPLSISVYQCQSYGSTWDNDFLEYVQTMIQLRLSFVADILLPYLQRWSCLDLFLSRNVVQNLLAAGMTAHSLRQLKGFHITYQSSVYPESDALEEQDMIGLLPPHLTSLTLTYRAGSSQMILSSDAKYLWAQLTELNWTVIWHPGFPTLSNETLDIISHCRALKSLKLQMHIYDNISVQERSAESINLHYLTSLSLSVVPTTEFASFVKRLDLPSLTSLHYEIRDVVLPEDTHMILEPFSNLMQSCGYTLELLQVYGAYGVLDCQDLINLLQFTPHLKDLKLFSERIDHSRWAQKLPSDMPSYTMVHQNGIGDDLLHAFARQEGRGELCPQLETLEISRGMVTTVTERALKEFVKARNRAHMNDPQIAALRKIFIPINAWKREETGESGTAEEKVSLGPDSAVYFKKMRMYSPESTLLPYVIEPWRYDWNDDDIHNEL